MVNLNSEVIQITPKDLSTEYIFFFCNLMKFYSHRFYRKSDCSTVCIKCNTTVNAYNKQHLLLLADLCTGVVYVLQFATSDLTSRLTKLFHFKLQSIFDWRTLLYPLFTAKYLNKVFKKKKSIKTWFMNRREGTACQSRKLRNWPGTTENGIIYPENNMTTN